LLISLRKHIDEYRGGGEAEVMPDYGGLSEATIAEFREMLLAVGRCAERAVPGVGTGVNQTMAGLQKLLVQPVSKDALTHTSQRAKDELSQWAERAFAHHKEIEHELHEILSVVSTAAESVGERDKKYASEIGALTTQLGSIAEQNDLVHMRRSIVESTRELKSCVARMTEESKFLVTTLSAEVREYRKRLDEAERISNMDPLTELANRRGFERHLEGRIAGGKPFSLIMVDLDEFKAVNDRYGHLAGDELLRQFAAELKAQFDMWDLVGRLGGDEFVAVTSGDLKASTARIENIRKYTLGEYKIRHEGQTVKVRLNASIGAAEWNGREASLELMARVDAEVYKAKKPGERRRLRS
jgi:diguanylate cyclase (GGDEF)-like protein